MAFDPQTRTFDFSSPAPDESLQLIKIQNKKITELYNEIENKDLLLSQLQNKLKESTSLYEENNHLKLQVENISHNLKEAEMKININEKTKVDVSEKETFYLNQISNMKTAYENEFNKYIEDLKFKNEKLNQLEIENKNLVNINKENTSIIEQLQKERALHMNKINQLTSNENGFQSRAKELVSIIQSQDEEIKKNLQQISLLSNHIHKMNIENQKISHHFNHTMSTFKSLENKNKESENIILSFNTQLQNEKNKTFDLTNSLSQQSNELACIKIKLNDAISLNHQHETLINELTHEKNELNSKCEASRLESLAFQNEIKNAVMYLTTLINTSLKWADTYIGVHLHEQSSSSSSSMLPPLENEISHELLNEKYNLGLVELYRCVNATIKDLHVRINSEFGRYEQAINEYEKQQQQLLMQIENFNKNTFDHSEKEKNYMNQHLESQQIIKTQSDEIEKLKSKLFLLSQSNEEYESKIIATHQQLIAFINDNIDTYESNVLYRNLFTNIHIEKPERTVMNKLNKVKDLLNIFTEMSICLIKQVGEKEQAIREYQSITEECKNLKEEISDMKKGYNAQTSSIMQEKENEINSYEKNKLNEFTKIEGEYRDKIEQLETLIKEKEEEMEKLNNDNNLLYSQYLLSEKNFEDYKKNRKEYDLQLQNKYEEVQKMFHDAEIENSKMRNELALIAVKYKSLEESIKNKNKENELLKNQLNDYVKNSLI